MWRADLCYNFKVIMLESVKKQLGLLLVLSVLFLFCDILIINFVDPFKAPVYVFFIFYLCLFLFTLSLLTLVLYIIRNRFTEGLYYQKIAAAFRESFLLSLLITGSLILSSKQILFWWTEISLAITLIFIELFFLI